MREIKFRGVTPKGEVVFGDLTHDGENVFIGEKRVNPYRIDQFAGYDENGDEVFENDIVISYGREYKVKLDFCYGVVHNIKLSRKK